MIFLSTLKLFVMKFIYHNISTHHYHNSNTPLKEERKWLLSTASFPLLPLSLSLR